MICVKDGCEIAARPKSNYCKKHQPGERGEYGKKTSSKSVLKKKAAKKVVKKVVKKAAKKV